MLVNLIRTFILYILIFIVMRMMGKRQIGELEPFEFIITVIIADLATIPMADTGLPLLSGIVPIFALLIIQLLLSYICLKSVKARKIICGSPSVIIRNGKLIEAELHRLRCNTHEVLEQLRIQQYLNVHDIDLAILETSGKLSIIPKANKRSVTPQDLKISTEKERLPIMAIVDGYIQEERLQEANLSKEWLLKQLKKNNYSQPDKILLAVVDEENQLFIQEKSVNKGDNKK